MTDPAQRIAAKAAKLIVRRDRLQADMRALDAQVQEQVTAYSRAMRTWGFTPTMLRQACEARGLLQRENGL